MLVDVEHIIAFIIVLIIILVVALFAYRAFIYRLLKEKNIQYQQELAHQKEVAEQYTHALESERKRIAQVLHDDVGNKLNILSLWINNEDTRNNERSKEIIAQQIPTLIESARTISHSLYPADLEKFGLVFAIEALIANVHTSLPIQLIITHTYREKPISFELQLYRIIQEFLSNVIKHANASTMFIYIRDTACSFSCILSDDGVGFDVENPQKGMGLTNIEARLSAVNAHFKWKSCKNKGTKLIIGIANNE